ncbi:MFS transporter (plasmid) [Saccharobesus litoralis]|uniref:MFS transporter n=1 Tax=Saccharobesus litoralis TaxID=2172099 RepID=A0A2S0VYK3_9ALTE|nr:MFS transporter [Saccharobesus litoralis]AWB69250.1 MFS transporter [Saccharobesus litoralis]
MQASNANLATIRWLTYLMFMMFAMTTDAVGVIIPEIIKEFDLSMTAAGAFHYGPMAAIAVSGILLGFLADRLGRKNTIIIGLCIFATACCLFALGNSFSFFLFLLVLSGLAIGIFKTGALALVGDISQSTENHTKTMNLVEGFFGVGAIIGPFIVTYFLSQGFSWKYLYITAGVICILLCITAALVQYPTTHKKSAEPVSLKHTIAMLKNPFALGFSCVIALYVAAEAAIYVWMPTLLANYDGSFTFLATWSLTIFFVLRALGRFLAVWLLNKIAWEVAMLILSSAICICYLASMTMGLDVAVILLPLSGLFMSMIYPTLNSKGISCFDKKQHGAIAGVILFFTAAAASFGPMLMGVFSDIMGGHAKYGFYMATGFAALLAAAMWYNWLKRPASRQLSNQDHADYD